MNQPFGWEIEKSGVKTRPSEQTVLLVEADLLLGYVVHIVRMVSHIAMSFD